jgi:two-component system sensor histidine kinase RegB
MILVGGDRSATITLRGLITARWVLMGLVLAIAGLDMVFQGRLAGLSLGSTPPLLAVLVVVAWGAHNIVVARLVGRGHASESLAGAHLIVDATALTFLIAISGGAANPFTTLYFVPITLATQVSPRWTWALAGYCLESFAALFVLVPLSAAQMDHGQMDHAHMGHAHGGSQFAGHLQGMWVAFGVSGVLITYFVHRIALSLARQRVELARLRRQAEEDRLLASIGALAAGAAHELGTPLGTIGLLSSELEHMSPQDRQEAIASIRRQVGRCKSIVQRMASPELRVETLGHHEPPWMLSSVLDDLPEIAGEIPLQIELEPEVARLRCRQPREAIAQILRELVANAREACRGQNGEAGIAVSIEQRLGEDGPELFIRVRDEGVGMDAQTLDRAFDPFYSTRPEGEGLGMGLFVARAHLRQLGGTIELDSEPGRGTSVQVRLPFAHPGSP